MDTLLVPESLMTGVNVPLEVSLQFAGKIFIYSDPDTINSTMQQPALTTMEIKRR